LVPQSGCERQGCQMALKIPIWVYFGGPWNVKCWYIWWLFGIFFGNYVNLYSQVVYFVVNWHMSSWSFGMFKKNLAILVSESVAAVCSGWAKFHHSWINFMPHLFYIRLYFDPFLIISSICS
jgi:hypothetical protein